ncbi:unnamed protein product [Malus baccata var. baccata]
MPVKASPEKSRHVNGGGNGCAWTANGLPLGQWSMMGEPIGLVQWEFSLLAMSSVAAILKFLNLNLVVVACKLDPGLQSFDVDLQQRTSYVITRFQLGWKSLKETRKWSMNTLRSLQTLNFCTSLEQCLNRALNNQLIIQAAIRQFEEEVGAWADGNRCARTLKELRAFKTAGDLFTDEFFVLFQAVNKNQVSMFEKLQLLAAAIAAPLLVRALAGALAVPIGLVGKWCNMLWNNYERGLKGQREIISSMQIGTFVAVKDLDNIRSVAMKLVIDEIKKKLGVFVETIDNVSQHADKSNQNRRTVILQRIIRHPDQ